MTFSAFAQNIKLEKVEFLLKTTDLPVEEVTRQPVLREKFDLTPNNLRNQKFSADRI
jgi:hypothetical protein